MWARVCQAIFFFANMLRVFCVFCFLCRAVAQPEEGYSREQLQPLTKFRQQHRRTVDGRLCAAAFVQDRCARYPANLRRIHARAVLTRQAYTSCTEAANPAGESGRPWCYVEAQALDCSLLRIISLRCRSWLLQLLESGGVGTAWNYCGAR